MSSHLHACPNRPKKNEILEIIQQQDPNEAYIPAGQWPAAFPQTPEVIDYIRNSGYLPPIELPPVEHWVEVTHRVKKSKDSASKYSNKKEYKRS